MHDSASWQRRLWMTDDSGGCVCVWGGRGDYEDKVSVGDLCERSHLKHMHTYQRFGPLYTLSHSHTQAFLPGISPSTWHSNYSTHWFQWWMNSQSGMSSLSSSSPPCVSHNLRLQRVPSPSQPRALTGGAHTCAVTPDNTVCSDVHIIQIRGNKSMLNCTAALMLGSDTFLLNTL